MKFSVKQRREPEHQWAFFDRVRPGIDGVVQICADIQKSFNPQIVLRRME